jgi:hypothetical protein
LIGLGWPDYKDAAPTPCYRICQRKTWLKTGEKKNEEMAKLKMRREQVWCKSEI